MKLRQPLTLLFLAFFTLSNAQTAAEKAVQKTVETLNKALLDSDIKTLTEGSMRELTYGHSSGLIEDKTQFIEGMASGKSDYFQLDISDVSIKVVGKIATVRHIMKGEGMLNNNKLILNLKVLLVFVKQKGQWKLLARQAVKAG
jgi:ketosteroid isomerase-like protein